MVFNAQPEHGGPHKMNPLFFRIIRAFFLALLLLALATAPPEKAQADDSTLPAPLAQAEPLLLQAGQSALLTIWIVGDSTAAKGPPTATGWGAPFSKMVDASKVNVVNGARGGRSSRTFVTQGLWDALLKEIKAGDWVLIQFGHNDAGAVNDVSRARGSLRTIGDETEQIHNLLTKKPETVQSYGWYLRKLITETKAKGATPVVLSLTVRNEWKDGKVERRNGPWNDLAEETARSSGVAFLHLTERIADAYDKLGPEKVKVFFPRDHTHTGADGAALTAQLLLEALRILQTPGTSGT